MQKNFKFWVRDNEFYEYLQSIMLPRNKFLLESILKAKTAKELDYLVEIYDLETENRELAKTISNIEELTNQKNKIIEENRQLAERNEELVRTVENLKNINKEHLESKSWKITKPLRTANKVFKNKEGYDEE